LPKKDHIKNIFVFTATTIMLTYLSRICYFFYFWLRKSSHRTIPHQSPIRTISTHFGLQGAKKIHSSGLTRRY
ncbi:MAG: hypothetical protein DRP41_06030, partial [Thermodesulfobacteriota bacterium]